MATVRAIQDQAVEDPDVGGYLVTVKSGAAFDDSHPIVRAYPWLFRSDAARDIERATAEPGEKRTVRR